jgi:protein involved in polysaccharide export with SLBB domain
MQPSSIRASAIALCALAGLTTACEQNDFSQADPSPNSEPNAVSARDLTAQDRAAAASTVPTNRPEAVRLEAARSESSRLAATIANLPALSPRRPLPPLPRLRTTLPSLRSSSLPPTRPLWQFPQNRGSAAPVARTAPSPQSSTGTPSRTPSGTPSAVTSENLGATSALPAAANPISAPAPAAIASNPTQTAPNSPFSQADIQGHWSQPLVTALINMGVVQGFADGNFRPDQPITQEQFLSMAQKAFPDEQIRPEMITVRQGMTRAEAAKVVYQALADQGRIAPLATLVATQNQPFDSANATASPSSGEGAIADPSPSPQPEQIEAANPEAENLTATNSSDNGSRENPVVLEPTVEPSPQSIALPEPTASPQPIDRQLNSEAVQASQPATTIAIVGEVSRPGAYSIDANANKPSTLIQAIQRAGGVTAQANIRQIEVHRGATILPIDLWQLLQAGDISKDISKDITLQPGDMISIPRAIELGSAGGVSTASPTPAQIQVNVVGEVKNPGLLKLPANASVNQAILASGGFNRQTQKAELLRLKANGSIARRVLTVDLAQGVNELTNPRLQNNDVLLVQPGSATVAQGGITLPSLIGILPTTAALQ